MCRPNKDDGKALTSTPSKSTSLSRDPMKKKRVSFGGEKVVAKLNPRNAMSTEERHALFYQRDDYEAFKDSIVDICNQVSTSYFKDNDDDLCTRGLERRMSTERQRLKNKAINDVLQAYHGGYSMEHVANVARTGAEWACDLASKMGMHDYYAAHDPLRISQKDYVVPCLPHDDVSCRPTTKNVDLPSRKRSVDDEMRQPPTRRVRMRMFEPTTAATTTSSSGWRRPRIAMWKPESLVKAR